MRDYIAYHWHVPPTGMTLFWARFGTIAAGLGWICLLLAIVGAPIVAAIYHATH